MPTLDTEVESAKRQRELIEAGRRYELLETIRKAVRDEIKQQFRLHYGTSSAEDIRDQHLRLKNYIKRWDRWMERFWYGFVAKALRWIVIIVIALNILAGNPIFYPFLDKLR